MTRVIFIVVALAFALQARAHFPILECQAVTQKEGGQAKLQCQAGYSDGSVSGKVVVKVLSYQEELLSSYTTASDGSITFAMPDGEFYVLFDPGHEAPAEFDYAELE